ncbi:MAG: enolase [Clostridia bacterium]
MENILEIVSVPAIATIVYWVINLVKYAVKSNEIFLRFIPLIAAVFGAVLGIVCFYALPSIIAADNFIMALLIGGASGLSATGANQIIKQLGKGKGDKNDGSKK